MSQQQFRPSPEQLLGHPTHCTHPSLPTLHERVVTIRTSLGFVTYMSLLLQRAEDRENRRVREFVLYPRSNVGDGRGPVLPEHVHEVDLSIRKDDFTHRTLSAYQQR